MPPRADCGTVWQRRPLAVLLLLFALSAATATAKAGPPPRYAIIIDAGSTGSRVHVFNVLSSGRGWPNVALPAAVKRTTPGLSTHVAHPAGVTQSLQPLLQFAQQQVPREAWASTPIRLYATGGLRLLPKAKTHALLATAMSTLAASGFNASTAATTSGSSAPAASLLPGVQEAGWAWLAVNYATGALQAASAAAEARALGRRQPHQLPALQGVLELGGASAQVAYPLPLSAPALQDPGAELALPGPGGVQRLAVASWDGLGLQAAREAWAGHLTGSGERRDPCLPHGWDGTRGLTGSADWRACREGVAALLRRGQLSCTAATGCRSTAATSARALPQPQEGIKLLGTDNVFYTARALGLKPGGPLSLKHLDTAAEAVCQKGPPSHGSGGGSGGSGGGTLPTTPTSTTAQRACLSAALVLAIARDALQLPPGQASLVPSNSVPTPSGAVVEVSWALGALLSEEVAGSIATTRGLATTAALPSKPAQKTAPHKAPGSGTAAVAAQHSDHSGRGATAAAGAASFCLLLLAGSACASALRLGVAPPTPPIPSVPRYTRVRVPLTTSVSERGTRGSSAPGGTESILAGTGLEGAALLSSVGSAARVPPLPPNLAPNLAQSRPRSGGGRAR